MRIKYYELLRVSKDIYEVRVKMVAFAKRNGIKPAAREFSTTVKTVRKWVKRYQKEGKPGLRDRSRRPKNSSNQMLPFWQFKIEDVCKQFEKNKKRISGAQMKRNYHVPYSHKTILKRMHGCGYKTHNRTKTEKKRDLREIKSKLKPFEKMQLDVKYLDDIPEMYHEYIFHRLPKYQFTARCVSTGALFFAYALEKTVTNASVFLLLLSRHLSKFSVDITGCCIQTDNGTEFTAPWNSIKVTTFTLVAELLCKAKHRLIPPGAKTWQSDVETSHRLIEDELYAYATFSSKRDFYRKAAQYQHTFNIQRQNSYKGGTPVQLIQQKDTSINLKVLKYKPYLIDTQLKRVKDELASLRYEEDVA